MSEKNSWKVSSLEKKALEYPKICIPIREMLTKKIRAARNSPPLITFLMVRLLAGCGEGLTFCVSLSSPQSFIRD